MPLLITLTVFSVPVAPGLGAEAAAHPLQGRLVELSTPKVFWSTHEVPVILLNITNADSRPYTGLLPYRWYQDVFDICSFHKDGEELSDRQAFTSYGISRQTTLGPGERVTFAYRLSTHVELAEGPARRGVYTVKLESIGDGGDPPRAVLGRPLTLWIGDTTPTPGFRPPDFDTEEDLRRAAAIIGLPTTTPHDRLLLLQAAAGTGRRDTLWGLIRSTDDAYAIVELLRDLPRPLLDREGLFHLLRSKDLAIRRTAVRTLADVGPDPAAAERLEAFLKTQSDGPTLVYGKGALQLLHSR